jgi:NAD(P)-dependent dehydrogenase (short-subunit alcohol dehydrogenase family)
MSGVSDRVIAITGGGRGLGLAYAQYMAAEGAKIVVNDIGADVHGAGVDSSAADAAVEQIRAVGGTAVACVADVTTEVGAKDIVDTALREYGQLDAVVNNAGTLRDVSFRKMTTDDWDSVMRTHLYGTYFVTKAAWSVFTEQGHGRVVMISSGTGLFGNFGQANYGAAKLGVIGLTNTLAIEGVKAGILVNAVSPGGATRMTEGVLTAEQAEQMSPMWVAPVVAYLCSEGCTSTGIVIRAMSGHYGRVALAVAPGIDLDEVPTLAAFSDRWDELVGGKPDWAME